MTAVRRLPTIGEYPPGTVLGPKSSAREGEFLIPIGNSPDRDFVYVLWWRHAYTGDPRFDLEIWEPNDEVLLWEPI